MIWELFVFLCESVPEENLVFIIVMSNAPGPLVHREVILFRARVRGYARSSRRSGE